jgi:hypothetical protein
MLSAARISMGKGSPLAKITVLIRKTHSMPRETSSSLSNLSIT